MRTGQVLLVYEAKAQVRFRSGVDEGRELLPLVFSSVVGTAMRKVIRGR